jgi:hypothetical protein
MLIWEHAMLHVCQNINKDISLHDLFYSIVYPFANIIQKSSPCHWFLLLGHMGVAFIERHLSLLILFIIFYVISFAELSSQYHPNIVNRYISISYLNLSALSDKYICLLSARAFANILLHYCN